MKLNYKRTFFVGLAFMSIYAFWQVYDGIIPLILKENFKIGDFAAGFIMAADNVLALFLLPLFGLLSDKTHTKLGRRIPFILCGTAIACVAMLLIPIAAQIGNLFLFFIGLGVVLLAMSIYRSPAVALMPDVTPRPLRSKGNAMMNVMGAIGGITTLILIKFLVPETQNPSYFPLFVATMAIMIISVIILYIKIKEPKCVAEMEKQSKAYENALPAGTADPATSADAIKGKMPRDVFVSLCFLLLSVFLWFMGYSAVATAFSKYANQAWGMEGGNYALVLLVTQAAAIVSYIPVGFLSDKIGRKNTVLIGIIMLAVSFGSVIFFKSFSGMIFFFFALAGIGWAFICVNSYPMVVDMSKGTDVGKYTGYYYTASMLAQTLAPIFSGWFLQNVGYQTLFPYGTIFVALSFVTLLMVKHGDSKVVSSKKRKVN